MIASNPHQPIHFIKTVCREDLSLLTGQNKFFELPVSEKHPQKKVNDRYMSMHEYVNALEIIFIGRKNLSHVPLYMYIKMFCTTPEGDKTNERASGNTKSNQRWIDRKKKTRGPGALTLCLVTR